MPSHYKILKEIIIKKLKQASLISFTSDYWSSLANKSYLTVTSHFLDDEFRLNKFVLKTIEV